ncbi:hypothetical protein [Mycoplasma phocimorsus]|uniref:hypothetical protein n=1 Tax=Mycoplasma phocimorsus TaxID=3045839 RepID=UPI0024BF25F9|nr:hypothetical protein [Mycoplasma phocimorsus]MDJ1648044.1 hypothetical protein [Mycoplasma phocimorsus]
MNKNKKIFNIALMVVNISLLINIVSCKNISLNKKLFKNNINDLIFKNDQNKLISYEYPENNKLNDEYSFKNIIKNKYLNNGFYIYENKNIFIESNLIEEEQKVEDNITEKENTNISINLFNELLEKRRRHQEKINTYKKWMIGFGIASSIIVGVSSGLGIYFGIKNSDKSISLTNQNLQEQINSYKNINSNDPFIKVIVKIIDIAYTKKLPQSILNFLKETILKDSFKNLNEKFENELVNKIMASKDITKFAVNDLLVELTKIGIKNNDKNTINNNIKKALTNIIEIYLPDLIKGILDFITIESKQKTKNSILADILIKILNDSNIGIKNSHDFSIILRTYVKLIIKKDNKLIDFIIKTASDAINQTNLTSNIINDIFTIINKFIDIIIARKSDKNEDKVIDVEKIVKILLPKILKIITFDKNNDYSSFVSFINKMFESKDEQNNSNFDWIYNLIKNGKINNITIKPTNENQNRKIIIPKLDINNHEKFFVLLELENISGYITKIFNLLFEPLIIQLKKNENENETKKAIVRLTGFISYIYYKLNNLKLNNKETFFNRLKRDLNPANPKYAIPKAIYKLFKKYEINNSIITDLFGKKVFDSYLYIFTIESYEIFTEAKKQAESNETSNLKKIFEQGNFQNLNDKNK